MTKKWETKGEKVSQYKETNVEDVRNDVQFLF